jgi:feruloyl esterase
MNARRTFRTAFVIRGLALIGVLTATEADAQVIDVCRSAANAVAANSPVAATTVRIIKAETLAANATYPSHCEIIGAINERVSPVDGHPYAIQFHLRMPNDWNGRFFMEGGGATNGTLSGALGALGGQQTTGALARGYSVISTDSGHDNIVDFDANAGGNAAFGADPQARLDFGYRSYDVVTQMGKALVHTFYGKQPDRSYFVGCSEGGREGFMFSQRFPTYYDGIVAGDPGFRLPYTTAEIPLLVQLFAPLARAAGQLDASGTPLINKVYTDADLQLASDAIMAACDRLDGLVDGMSSNLAACTDPVVTPKLEALACPRAKADGCLTSAQIAGLRSAYAGPKDSAGSPVYASTPWDPGIGGMAGTVFNTGFRSWWWGTFDSTTNNAMKLTLSAPSHATVWSTPPVLLPLSQLFNFEVNFKIDRTVPNVSSRSGIYAQSPAEFGLMEATDLTAFAAHGGKMLIYHGNADPAFSVNDTIDWYEAMNQRMGATAATFVKLFTVPGMNHCRGGPGTDSFDMLTPLVDWVEKGNAPDSIPAAASNPRYFGVNARSRPLCAYPTWAHYDGSGEINDAANFTCK